MYAGHRQLYVQARILHRDLSSQNILYYTEKGGRERAILNDYDLAVILDKNWEGTGATSKHRTGTGPYMARELLQELPKPRGGEKPIVVKHEYAYELESWMYIMVFAMLGYGSESRLGVDLLKAWRSSNWTTIGEQKSLFILEKHSNIIIRSSPLLFLEVKIQGTAFRT